MIFTMIHVVIGFYTRSIFTCSRLEGYNGIPKCGTILNYI